MSIGELRVLQKIDVSPHPPFPSQAPHPLSFLDSIWLSGAKVERLFFYDFPHPTSHFIECHLHSFITSLSRALRFFYPLAGTVRPCPASDDQFEIIYTEGKSVPVTIAEFTGEEFCHLSGHHPQNFNKLRLLLPRKPESSTGRQTPLLSVQVTLFPNQGMCIGFTLKHTVCDGSGWMQFIRTWAASCRSTDGTFDMVAPLLDRSVIVDSHGLRRKLVEIATQFFEFLVEPLTEQPAVKAFSASLVYGTFTLSQVQIARLKKKVQARAMEKGTPLLHISTFVVTCAYVLRCLVMSKRYDSDCDVYFSCAVDWRKRMTPPLSNYFGNCLGSALTEAMKAGKIAESDGVEVAAMEIGKGIVELQGKEIGEVIEKNFDKYLEIVKTKSMTLSVSGSPKLGVYETDFGWGRPVKVEVTSIAETGAMALAESREEEGGVEIGLVLPEEQMKEFKEIFESCLC